MIYLDANVFIFANLNSQSIGDAARSLLRDVQVGKVEAATSTLSFDELTWAVKKNRSPEDSVVAGEAFLNMPRLKLVEVDADLLAGALKVTKEYALDPRDSIHAASAVKEGADVVVSTDRHFEKVKELRRRDLSGARSK
jgi:predicted nucleic acid-binding protein